MNNTILGGQLLINETDVWPAYGVFLTEERRGGRENQAAIFAASRTKAHTAVSIREENGEKYSKKLVQRNEARDVTLHFALYADTKAKWMEQYEQFIRFLKAGNDGWLNVSFPGLGLTLRMFYVESTAFRALTYIWKEGKQAGSFKVKFREPEPIF